MAEFGLNVGRSLVLIVPGWLAYAIAQRYPDMSAVQVAAFGLLLYATVAIPLTRPLTSPGVTHLAAALVVSLVSGAGCAWHLHRSPISEGNDGYIPDSATLVTLTLGVTVLAPLAAVAPPHALGAQRGRWAPLIVTLPGIALPFGGEALSQYLGWGGRSVLPAFIAAMLIGVVFISSARAFASALRPRSAPTGSRWWDWLVVLVTSMWGCLVGGLATAATLLSDQVLNPLDRPFAIATLLGGLTAALALFRAVGAKTKQAP